MNRNRLLAVVAICALAASMTMLTAQAKDPNPPGRQTPQFKVAKFVVPSATVPTAYLNLHYSLTLTPDTSDSVLTGARLRLDVKGQVYTSVQCNVATDRAVLVEHYYVSSEEFVRFERSSPSDFQDGGYSLPLAGASSYTCWFSFYSDGAGGEIRDLELALYYLDNAMDMGTTTLTPQP